MNLKEIETLTDAYAARRRALEQRVQALHDEIERVKRKALDGIRDAVAHAAKARHDLEAAIQASPTVFTRPKSQIFAGIQVGYRKKKGKVVIEDQAAVVARIRKELPADQAELLIRVTEEVDKNAAAALAGSDLKRLGIQITADTDEPFIKPVDSDVDKLVKALLADIEGMEVEA